MSFIHLLRKSLVFILPLFLIAVSLFTACEKEKEVEVPVEVIVRDTVTVHDTVTVEIFSITVDNIMADPDSITQGQTLTLTAVATKESYVGDLEFSWFATGGMFSAAVGDTVEWTAPDDAGTYKVTVHATDGEYIAVGSNMIGVGMYAATVTPYYVGEAKCTCHSETRTSWAETGHAEAWAGLMQSDHAASYCFPCHSVGYEGDFGNSGYDEAPIEMFEDVQCENCHDAGSDHIAGPTADNITVNYEAENCGKCHEGAHHPYVTEWEESPHNFDPYTAAHGAGLNGGCTGCHEGYESLVRLSDEAGLATFYGGLPYGTPLRDTTEVKVIGVTCQVCHVSHSNENPGQVRTVADVPLVTANGVSPVITDGGVGKLCMHCHHARRAAEPQIENGYAHFGPHANPQADMMAGQSAYHAVADASFPWAGESHLKVQNSCKTCHIDMIEYGVVGDAVTGHTFEPTVNACENCHGTISSFDDIMALDDFDGDGTVEGVQSEVAGLLHLLEEALVADGLDTTGTSITGALGDTLKSTYKQREAGYNLAFVEDDKSHGVHNPDYAIQLLQQSYQYLTNKKVPNAVILRDQKAVAYDW